MQVEKNIQIKELELEDCCNLLEDSRIVETKDAGSFVTHIVVHPQHGRLIIVNSACGKSIAILS